MAEKNDKKPFLSLNTSLSVARKNGVTVNVNVMCADWEMVEKLLSDFENTLLKGNNGKP